MAGKNACVAQKQKVVSSPIVNCATLTHNRFSPMKTASLKKSKSKFHASPLSKGDAEMGTIAARQQSRWDIGQRLFQVEWCAGCPSIDGCPGEADLDNADHRYETFTDRTQASARATQLLRDRLDFFGCIFVRQLEVISRRDFESGDFDAHYDARGFYIEIGEPEEFS